MYTQVTPYADTTYATAFLDDQVVDSDIITAWEALSSSEQTKYLVRATSQIDKFMFVGYKTDIDQARQFPRGGDSTTPDEILQATCLEAFSLAVGNTLGYEGDYNLKKEKMDKAEWEYFDTSSVTTYNSYGKSLLTSNEAMMLIAPWIQSPTRIDYLRS